MIITEDSKKKGRQGQGGMALPHHPYLRRKLPLKRKRAHSVLGFTEMKGMALGILTQTQGLAQESVGYLNKEADPLACS